MINVVDALGNLGIEYEEHGVEALALCPMHAERTGKEDNNPSWWINLESGMHIVSLVAIRVTCCSLFVIS